MYAYKPHKAILVILRASGNIDANIALLRSASPETRARRKNVVNNSAALSTRVIAALSPAAGIQTLRVFALAIIVVRPRREGDSLLGIRGMSRQLIVETVAASRCTNPPRQAEQWR